MELSEYPPTEASGAIIVPSPETGSSEELSHESQNMAPTQEFKLLRAITHESIQIDNDWLQELDRLIDEGSVKGDNYNPSARTSKEKIDMEIARRQFEVHLGLDRPGHILREAYMLATRNSSALAPKVILNALRALTEIAGDVQDGIDMTNGSHARFLLTSGPKVLRSHYRYIKRVAAALGWQGDVRQLVRDEAFLLGISVKRLGILARIAARFGTDEDRQMGSRAIGRMTKGTAPEEFILGIITRGEGYTLGKRSGFNSKGSIKIKELRETLYQKLKEPENVKLVGHSILRAYFLYQPPEKAMQKKYPRLRRLLPARITLPEEEIRKKEIPQVITGDEPWLSEINLPSNPKSRKGWLTKVNRRIAEGSHPLNKVHSRNPRYDEITEHRIHFYKLLGWTSPSHRLNEQFEHVMLASGYPVSPERTVDILNLLTEYNVQPIMAILERCMEIVKCNPPKLRSMFDQILSAGFDVNEMVHDRPTIFTRGENKFQTSLRRLTKDGGIVTGA